MRVTDAIGVPMLLCVILLAAAGPIEKNDLTVGPDTAAEPWNMFIGAFKKGAAMPFDSKSACTSAASALRRSDSDLSDSNLVCFGQTSGGVIVIDRHGNIEELK